MILRLWANLSQTWKIEDGTETLFNENVKDKCPSEIQITDNKLKAQELSFKKSRR